MTDIKLTSINGLTPEEYMVRQRAAEERVRKKNRREHIIYSFIALMLMVLAATRGQYLLATTTIVCGWVTLWFSQNEPIGLDGGMPRTRGLPPIFGLVLFIFPVAAVVAFIALIYAFATGS